MNKDSKSLALTLPQLELIHHPIGGCVFLEGPAGCGKTTVAVERLLALMAAGVPGNTILLLVPQRTLAEPYQKALRNPGGIAGGMVSILTLGGLAQRMVELFWPLVAEEAGFGHPDELPTFLTLETAQYYMAHLVQPLLTEGLFDSVTIERNRLYSQIIDNLNKAAVVGFPYAEIGQRLKAAWIGEPGQAHIYEDAQTCVSLFRRYCLENNLLDFSLQVEVFRKNLWTLPACRNYLFSLYRHILVDNLEEDTPVTHDLLVEWLPEFISALLIYDHQAGFRRFLGADPQSAYRLKNLCPEQLVLNESFVNARPIQVLGERLGRTLAPVGGTEQPGFSHASQAELEEVEQAALVQAALDYGYHRFYPQMLDWVAAQIASLVNNDNISPGEIVVLAPFLSDALRFSLTNRLEHLGVPVRSHRPSRSLREEPATQCLLTLSTLAYPEWGITPTRSDVAYALVQAIQDLDLVRGQLLTDIVYRKRENRCVLSSFDLIRSEVQERITYRLGERYERLRAWLEEIKGQALEFDHFLSRLFGEVLSQPGFGFHAGYTAGEVTANLIESVQKFRWAAGRVLHAESQPFQASNSVGKEYLAMVADGVIAAQYIRSWQVQPGEAVLLAPAYTFLMSNRPVMIQFWLDVGGRGWIERLYQPLTHPYVLSRNWSVQRVWNDSDEVNVTQETLYRLALGLLHRCRRKVYLGFSELNEQGYEQRGPLLQAFQRVLRSISISE